MGACLDTGVGDLVLWPQSSCFDLCPSVYLDAELTSTHILYYEVGNLTNLINTYWIVIAIQLCPFALYFYYLITSHLIQSLFPNYYFCYIVNLYSCFFQESNVLCCVIHPSILLQYSWCITSTTVELLEWQLSYIDGGQATQTAVKLLGLGSSY